MSESRNSHMILVGQPKGRWSLGVTWRQAKDNNKIGHQGRGCGGLEWNNLAEGKEEWTAAVKKVIKLPRSIKRDEFFLLSPDEEFRFMQSYRPDAVNG